MKPKLADTKFDFAEHNDYVEATCPWGNTIRLHEPDAARFGRIKLGIPYVEFDVPVGTAKGIAKFYREMIDVPAEVVNGDGTTAKVTVGKNQNLLFRETDKPLPDYDEHHVQIYVVNFSGPHSGSASAAWSTARTTSTSTASATSPISTPASTCSPSSTRCAASPIRCSCGRWSTAIRRRPRATTPTATTRTPGRWSRSTSTISRRAARRRWPRPANQLIEAQRPAVRKDVRRRSSG